MAKLTPMRAIRLKCLECCAGQRLEVRECLLKTCPLYGYRMGHRPKGEQFTIEDNKNKNQPCSYGVISTEQKIDINNGREMRLPALMLSFCLIFVDIRLQNDVNQIVQTSVFAFGDFFQICF